MQQHELRSAPGARRPKKRIGRGNASGTGTYAGKGLKGQKARTGNDLRIAFEGGQLPLARKLARKRGFTNNFRVLYECVNVGQLARLRAEATITPELLLRAGLVHRPQRPLKVLGDGAIDRPIQVSAHAFTASARSKIEAAGGSVEQLPGRAADRAARLQAAQPSSAEAKESL